MKVQLPAKLSGKDFMTLPSGKRLYLYKSRGGSPMSVPVPPGTTSPETYHNTSTRTRPFTISSAGAMVRLALSLCFKMFYQELPLEPSWKWKQILCGSIRPFFQQISCSNRRRSTHQSALNR